MHPSYHPRQLAKSGAAHQGVSPATRQFQGVPLPNSADQTHLDNTDKNLAEPSQPTQTQNPAMYYSSAP